MAKKGAARHANGPRPSAASPSIAAPEPKAILIGRHPELGSVFAAVDSEARFVRGEIRPSKLGALLAPFRNATEARAALKAAGAAIEAG